MAINTLSVDTETTEEKWFSINNLSENDKERIKKESEQIKKVESEITEDKNKNNEKIAELKNKLNDKKEPITNIIDKYSLQPGWADNLKKEFWYIENFYKKWLKAVQITEGSIDEIVKNVNAVMGDYIDIENEKIQKNIFNLMTMVKQIAEAHNEHDFIVVGNDGAIHFLNDIDTGYYILPKNILEKWDVTTLAKQNKDGTWSRWARPIKGLDEINGKEEVLQIGENKPLVKNNPNQ